MNNTILKYIEANKNKDWNELEFNDLDALIFSLLSYIDFSNIIKYPMSIKDAYNIYKQKIHLKKNLKFFKKCTNLFTILATTLRYQNIILENFVKVNNNLGQFAAVTIKTKDFIFISFEGTDCNLSGWEENLKLSYQYPVYAQEMAQKYVKDIMKFNNKQIYIGGHSKGGNLAIAAVFNLSILKYFRIKSIYNFDGPGFLKKEANSFKFKLISKKIKNFMPEESIVGTILNNPIKPTIIKSKGKKIKQHDAFLWLCNNTNFVNGTLSNFSLDIKKRFDNLLNKYNDKQKELFVNTVFKILYNSGYKETTEFMEIDFKKIYNFIRESIKLTKEEKQIIINALKILKEKNK